MHSATMKTTKIKYVFCVVLQFIKKSSYFENKCVLYYHKFTYV